MNSAHMRLSRIGKDSGLEEMINAVTEDGYQLQLEHLYDTHYAYIQEGQAVAMATGSHAFSVTEAIREAITILLNGEDA